MTTHLHAPSGVMIRGRRSMIDAKMLAGGVWRGSGRGLWSTFAGSLRLANWSPELAVKFWRLCGYRAQARVWPHDPCE
jgi:hypothetical protein